MKNVLKGLFFYEVDSGGWPLVDIYETEDEVVFEIDVPGADPADISVRCFEDILVAEGTIADPDMGSGSKYLCMERGTKDFRRVLKIPVPVSGSGARALYSRGVVTIRLRKHKGKLLEIPVERGAV